MKKGITGLALAAALLPAAVSAESLSYNYVEAGAAFYPGYESQDFLGVDVRGSFAINENIFAFGGIKFLTDDVDYTAAHVGAGFRHGLDPKTDIWGGLTVEYQEVDGGRECFNFGFGIIQCVSYEADDTALGLRAGLRHQLTEQLEVGASGRIITGDLDYFGVTATGRFTIREDLKLFADADIQDGELGVIGGVTLEF